MRELCIAILMITSFILILGCSKFTNEKKESSERSKLVVMNKEIQQYLFLAQDILEDYVTIHDKLFETSDSELHYLIRIFHPMDFKNYKDTLMGLNEELGEINKRLSKMNDKNLTKEEIQLISHMQKYLQLLGKTISELGMICSRLERHSADLSYRRQNYNDDVDNYQKSVDRYLEYGKIVNNQLENFLITK